MTVLTTDTLLIELAVLLNEGGVTIDAAQLADNLDTEYEVVGLDSLARLNLVIAIGSRYGIRIDDATADTLTTPAATLAYLTDARRGEA